MVARKSAEERFFSKVAESTTNEFEGTPCWEWTAASKHGYGLFHIRPGKQVSAHRWAFEFLRGEIPAGLVCDHLCRNKACVNPWHLDPVTDRVNLERGGGLGKANLVKTECLHGHPYSPQNTYVDRMGHRHCRICKKVASARWEARLAEQGKTRGTGGRLGRPRDSA